MPTPEERDEISKVPDHESNPDRARVETELRSTIDRLHHAVQAEHILQFFAYEHLPPHLQAVSRPFGLLAKAIAEGDEAGPALPRNPERTVALRKLLEAKDAAVRALVAK